MVLITILALKHLSICSGIALFYNQINFLFIIMNNVNLTLTLTYTQQYASLLPEVLCLPSAATTMMNFIFYHYF
jgi:hypothetical protein